MAKTIYPLIIRFAAIIAAAAALTAFHSHHVSVGGSLQTTAQLEHRVLFCHCPSDARDCPYTGGEAIALIVEGDGVTDSANAPFLRVYTLNGSRKRVLTEAKRCFNAQTATGNRPVK